MQCVSRYGRQRGKSGGRKKEARVSEVSLGRRVYDLRKAAGMSQHDLVNKLATYGIHVRQSHISGVENGGSNPSVEMLVGLVCALNTNADYLLGLTDDPCSVDVMAKTVAKVVNDDAQRAVLREIVARVSALSLEDQLYVNDLLARLFSHAVIEHGPG